MSIRIFCSVGHYAPMSDFSNKATTQYQEAKHRGRFCKVVCKRHTGGSIQELRCDDCGEIKSIDAFSNAARKAHNSPRCRDCVSWTEADTTAANPLPAPLEARAPDETKLRRNPRDEFDDEADELSGGGFDIMSVHENATDVNRGSASSVSRGNGRCLTSAESAPNYYDDRIPTLNRGRSGYNPSSAPSNQSDLVSTAGTERPRLTNGKQYTAYGHNGQVQQREQSVISTTDITSVTNMDIAAAQNSKGFAKVSGRKAPVIAPDYLTNTHPDEPRRYYRFDDDSGSEDEC